MLDWKVCSLLAIMCLVAIGIYDAAHVFQRGWTRIDRLFHTCIIVVCIIVVFAIRLL